MKINQILTTLSTLREPIKRSTYAIVGISLALVKYLGDTALIWFALHRLWLPTDYLHTVHSLLDSDLPGAPGWLAFALMLWTIPFVWIGVSFTLRRALDAGWSPWLCLLFFIPFVEYLLILLLCLWPSSKKYSLASIQPREPSDESLFFRAAFGVIAGLAFGLLMIGIAVVFKGQYGLALFIGCPFGIGTIAGYFLCRAGEAETIELFKVVFFTLLCIAGALLLVAYEGAICLALAFPLAYVVACLGAFVGRALAAGRSIAGAPPIAAMLLIPLFAFVEPAHLSGHTLHQVNSSVVIDATPEQVWPQVIAFAPIPEPQDVMFRLGIAYPKFAHIEGTGVGATRYCVFSTGPFVEPITAWEPAKRLAFDVTSSPDPMRELSWYQDVHPPHLHGYLRSRHGEFRLVALPNNRTRLEGTTWYEIEMSPEPYWSAWSDLVIHKIHMRVLQHIKEETESAAATTEVRP
jgi:uncharacterized membrane protein YhaH (DUF805 family)